MILGLSQDLHVSKSHILTKESTQKCWTMPITNLPLHKYLHFTTLHKQICKYHTSPETCNFDPYTWGFSASQACTWLFFSQRIYFSASHSNSPVVGASDIGQESAYTGKLKELPTGTSQKVVLLYIYHRYVGCIRLYVYKINSNLLRQISHAIHTTTPDHIIKTMWRSISISWIKIWYKTLLNT